MKKLIMILFASLFVVAVAFAEEPTGQTPAPGQPTTNVTPTPVAPTTAQPRATKTAVKRHRKTKKVVKTQAPAPTQNGSNAQPSGSTTAQAN